MELSDFYVYAIHSPTACPERTEPFKRELERVGFVEPMVTWITEEPRENEISAFFDLTGHKWQDKMRNAGYWEIPPRPLKESEISLAYKHLLAYHHYATRCDIKHKPAIFIEDDVFFKDNFLSFIDSLNSEHFNFGADAIFLGSEAHGAQPIDRWKPSPHLQEVLPPFSRTTDCYILRQPITNIGSISLPIDFELSYLLARGNTNIVCHLIDPCVKQGSHSGVYKSKIQ